MNGSRPLMLLTFKSVTSPFVAVRIPVFVKIDESISACTIDVEMSVVDVIVTLIKRACITSAISCPVLITSAAIDDVVRLLKEEMKGANPLIELTFKSVTNPCSLYIVEM